MRDLFRLANDIQSFCRERGWKFCFIGGLALQRWGEPRLTGDVDLTILTGFGDETAYIEQLCRAFLDALRTALVEAELQPLCELKEAPDILTRLRALQASHGDGPAS